MYVLGLLKLTDFVNVIFSSHGVNGQECAVGEVVLKLAAISCASSSDVARCKDKGSFHGLYCCKICREFHVFVRLKSQFLSGGKNCTITAKNRT